MGARIVTSYEKPDVARLSTDPDMRREQINEAAYAALVNARISGVPIEVPDGWDRDAVAAFWRYLADRGVPPPM